MAENQMQTITPGDNAGWAATLNNNIATFNDFATSSHWAKGEVKTDNKPIGINGCTVDGWSYTPFYLNGQIVCYLLYVSISGAKMGDVGSFAFANISAPFNPGVNNMVGGLGGESTGMHGVRTSDGHWFAARGIGLNGEKLAGEFILFP